ncbi:cache domain-containing protein [Duganella sp.]|uniref:cache domain-containing protein n=1 Tax=Duganella sp. TaxID=1904440 RepID=UPI0031D788E2
MKFSHITAALVLAAALPAFAQDKQDAIALVDKAVVNIQKKGIDEACKEFADPKGGYIQGELYVFVHDAAGTMKCHGTNPKLNNKDMTQLRDANGKYFSKEMRDLAMSGKTGWVDYVWVNPVSKALEPKSSYVKKADDKYWVGVGIYTKK